MAHKQTNNVAKSFAYSFLLWLYKKKKNSFGFYVDEQSFFFFRTLTVVRSAQEECPICVLMCAKNVLVLQ